MHHITCFKYKLWILMRSVFILHTSLLNDEPVGNYKIKTSASCRLGVKLHQYGPELNSSINF